MVAKGVGETKGHGRPVLVLVLVKGTAAPLLGKGGKGERSKGGKGAKGGRGQGHGDWGVERPSHADGPELQMKRWT